MPLTIPHHLASIFTAFGIACVVVAPLSAAPQSRSTHHAPAPSGSVQLIQSESSHMHVPAGEPSWQTNGGMSCDQTNTVCTWMLPTPITGGSTIVGYDHTFEDSDSQLIPLLSMTDNLGDVYTVGSQIQWVPNAEYIGAFALANAPSGVTSLTFTLDNPNHYPITYEDVGLTEYSCGAQPCAISYSAGPFLSQNDPAPSLNINASGPAQIWAFGAIFATCPTTVTQCIQTSGYETVLSDNGDNIAVWGPTADVAAGSYTIQFNSPNANADPDVCPGSNGCPSVLMALTIQPAN